MLSPKGAYYVDPYYHLDTSLYASYFATGNFRIPEAKAIGSSESNATVDVISNRDSSGVTGEGPSTGGNAQGRTGTELRIYRTAVAATGEYTAFHGGTVGLGQAAVVTAMNRVSGIYESELTIRLQLVANNNTIIYTNAGTDPYSNNSASALLGENQSDPQLCSSHEPQSKTADAIGLIGSRTAGWDLPCCSPLVKLPCASDQPGSTSRAYGLATVCASRILVKCHRRVERLNPSPTRPSWFTQQETS